jgi:hypothetical protein
VSQLPAGYFAALAEQLAFMSAVLGGFAVTFFATLLATRSSKRVISWAIASAGVSASSLICAALAASFLAVATHPEAISSAATAAQSAGPRVTVALCLFLGIYALLAALALSGWARSRRVGWITSIGAGISALLSTWMLTGF